MSTLSTADRFWRNVQRAGANDCWLWMGVRNNDGYGIFHPNRLGANQTTIAAHRFAYQLTNSKIPDGKELDHLCRNRRCVNPSHLEPVTHRQNLLRGERWNHPKTHCKHGHEFTRQNTYLYRNWRQCRICMTEATRRYRENKQKETR
jgi:hypothetical protein